MTPVEAISMLKKVPVSEEIVISWWRKEDFSVSSSTWNNSVDKIENNLDWSHDYDAILQLLKYGKRDY
mgnify:CR=1 FL=1|jgi:hypothetical protein|tara:strand:+ start:134 stop:337 length:204 start_codon:yes stop_codon:yes gene_type:complete